VIAQLTVDDFHRRPVYYHRSSEGFRAPAFEILKESAQWPTKTKTADSDLSSKRAPASPRLQRPRAEKSHAFTRKQLDYKPDSGRGHPGPGLESLFSPKLDLKR